MRTLGNDLSNTVSQFLSAGKSEIIFKSQVTPDIRIDLSSLLKTGPASQTAVKSQDQAAMKFIKPEIILTSMGVEKSIAPYGKPTTNFYSTIVYGAIFMALLGGASAWWLCRRR